jgi:meso-butanediol dehydrogenase/(S,S)-butanediol dehydrogenase/diacetyl reductase
MKGLHGKVALCTGSGLEGGLGHGILKRLGEAGCQLVVTDLDTIMTNGGTRSSDENPVVRELLDAGANAIGIACDVSEEASIVGAVESVMSHFGHFDILINNAAIGDIIKPLTELNLREWQQVITVNLTGAFLFTREAARVMDNGASIVNIASQAAKTGFRQMAPYVSSKHGMIGLTRTAAIDLASKGIRVSAVCPNHMTTTVGKAQSEYFSSHRGWPEAYRAQISEHIPLGRVGRLEDTAAAVAFLASDEAAFITGEALNVSGGEETH